MLAHQLLIGAAEVQTAPHHLQRVVEQQRGRKVVGDVVEREFLAPCGVPGPAQKRGPGRGVLGRGVQRNGGGVLAGGTDEGHRVGPGTQLGNPLREAGQHPAHRVGRIGSRELRRDVDRVFAARQAAVDEQFGGQQRVGQHVDTVSGVQMCCPPVHLDHPAAVDPSGGDPVADLEGLLEEHEQPRDDLPHGVLQRQAEHDRADAQRGEQTTDVGAPDEREDQRDTDGDQDEPGDVEEDRRNPLAPAAFRRTLEHRRVESGQQQDQDDEAEHRGHHPHGGGIGAHLRRLE